MNGLRPPSRGPSCQSGEQLHKHIACSLTHDVCAPSFEDLGRSNQGKLYGDIGAETELSRMKSGPDFAHHHQPAEHLVHFKSFINIPD